MNIKPLRDNIIIVKEEKSLTTSSGIILKTNDEADRARVVAIGPDVVDVGVLIVEIILAAAWLYDHSRTQRSLSCVVCASWAVVIG